MIKVLAVALGLSQSSPVDFLLITEKIVMSCRPYQRSGFANFVENVSVDDLKANKQLIPATSYSVWPEIYLLRNLKFFSFSTLREGERGWLGPFEGNSVHFANEIVLQDDEAIFYLNHVGWRVAAIFYLDCQIDHASVVKIDRRNNANRKIGPDLGFANPSGVSSHFLSGFQSSPNKKHSEKSNHGEPDGSYEHSKRPRSHILLSLQVILGLLYAAVSAYIVSQTSKPVDQASFIHDGPAGAWAMLGGIGIILGCACAFIGVAILVG